MSCCGCGKFNPTSCAQCCSQWTLPGGATAVPTEIQATVSIGAFEVCFVAARNLGFALSYGAKLGTLSLNGTYTLVRQNIGSSGCGSWVYENCSNNESIYVQAGLVYASGQCVWSATINYKKWLPCDGAAFGPGEVYRTADNLSCNGVDYGFWASAAGTSTGGLFPLPTSTMTFPCQAGVHSALIQHGDGKNPSFTWANWCNRSVVRCLTPTSVGCGAIGWPGDCPNAPSSTVTITLTV
jgi:hypothetical protein